MRVLHVYRSHQLQQSVSQAGLERFTREVFSNTEAMGVDTRAFTLNQQPGTSSFSMAALETFRDLVSWCELVHYHCPSPFGDLLHFLGDVDKPTLITYHADNVHPSLQSQSYSYAPLENLFLNQADKIICTVPNAFATHPVLSRHVSKVQFIPMGLNESALSAARGENFEDIAARFGENFFLINSAPHNDQQMQQLLEACKNAPYQAMVLGNGPREGCLQQLSKEQGIRNIKFVGKVTENTRAGLFKLANGIVYPAYTRADSLSLMLMEAAMHGKASVSCTQTDNSGYVNIDGVTGKVLPDTSADALRRAMDELYCAPHYAAELGINARYRFEALFTGKKIAAQYIDSYKQVLATPVDDVLPAA